MTFDWTITVGNLVSAIGPVIGFVIIGLVFISKIGTQIALIDQRLGSAETDLRDMASGVRHLAASSTEIARISERVAGVDRRMDDLSRRVNSCEKNQS